jgi:transcriptional regulator with GAF, ATPase, and Fis domain
MHLLLDVWREACRHIEIGEFVARIAPRIAQRIPFQHLLVRRLEPERSRLETVAAVTREARGEAPRARTELGASELAELRRWCTGGPLLVRGAEGAVMLRQLAPPDLDGPVLAVPLASGAELGVLLFHAGTAVPYAPGHLEVAHALLEPFAAALENDHRFHELARLREAALADNQALLSRLGRQDISESIVGAEHGLRAVMQRVEKVAATDAPVLILGETGSGKEVIARALHSRSPRRAGPIVRVNCGAIPTELVDSELFGH